MKKHGRTHKKTYEEMYRKDQQQKLTKELPFFFATSLFCFVCWNLFVEFVWGSVCVRVSLVIVSLCCVDTFHLFIFRWFLVLVFGKHYGLEIAETYGGTPLCGHY